MAFPSWKPLRSLRALGAFLFQDLSQEEFGRLFRREAPVLLGHHLKDWDEAASQGRFAPVRFLSKLRFLAARVLEQISPARRFFLFLAFVLMVISMFTTGNLPLYAFAILAFLLVLELSEKLLARDEIEIAREVQRSLFPREDPAVEGWTLASRNVPANDVGGDYYDYVPLLGSGSWGIALGDVAGKGMGAALLVANLQATLRAYLNIDLGGESAEPGPGGRQRSAAEMETLFSLLNRALASVVQSNRFASLVYGELDPGSGRFVYVNAGQNPPMVLRADGSLLQLPPGGMILGILAEAGYRAAEVALGPGDALVLYCDGVTERFDAEGEEFGEERLAEVLARCRGQAAASIRDAVLEAVAAHAGETPAHDDVTIVVLARNA
jgi:sigma-B regulation protein RsbU (phosphoserine phosphatase)